MKGYDAAFVAKDLDRLATFYHPDVTIFEGGGINNGWVDYRDHHLGPELKIRHSHTSSRPRRPPGAILMCEDASLQDARIKELCKTIVAGQRQEIDQMRVILQEFANGR